MTRAEFYFNRKVTCGDLAWVLEKALPEATRVTADGVDVVLGEGDTFPYHLGIVYVLHFADDSFLSIGDIGGTNAKIQWGIRVPNN